MYFRDLDPEVFQSHVQIWSYPDMSMVQEGQPILKEQWSKWDAESIAQGEAQEYQGIEFDVASILYRYALSVFSISIQKIFYIF